MTILINHVSNNNNNLKMALPDILNILVPYASDNFDHLTESPVFVDKSLFIQQVLSLNSHCLITSPRRWGKTFNLTC